MAQKVIANGDELDKHAGLLVTMGAGKEPGELEVAAAMGRFKEGLETVRGSMSLLEHLLLQMHLICNRKDPLWKGVKVDLRPPILLAGHIL
jgi:hypothetical protein